MQLAKRVATAAVLIPLVLLLVLRAPLALLSLVAGGVALLTVKELLELSAAYGIHPLFKSTYGFTLGFFLLLAANPGSDTPLLSTAEFGHTAIFAAALAPFFFLAVAMAEDNLGRAFPAALVSTFSFCYVVLPLAFLVQLREQWAGSFLLLYLLLVVWAGDIFAYFVGKPFGRHRMSPRISPHKTWEGAVASLVASLVVGAWIYRGALPISSALLKIHWIQPRDGYLALQPPPLGPVLLLSAAINLAAQIGDLAESLIKRGAGVKDSGAILPGHGGMLDRVDALLFAAPVLWYYAAWRVMQ